MAACLHTDFVMHIVGANEQIHGKSNFLRVIEKVFSELKDWKLGVGRMMGEDIIAVEFDGAGFFSGEYEGKKYYNVPLKVQSVSVFDFENGLIKKCAEYYDSNSFKKQLIQSGQ